MLPRREAAFPTGEGGSPQARRMRGNTLSQRAKPGLNHQVSPPHPSRAAPGPPSPAGEGCLPAGEEGRHQVQPGTAPPPSRLRRATLSQERVFFKNPFVWHRASSFSTPASWSLWAKPRASENSGPGRKPSSTGFAGDSRLRHGLPVGFQADPKQLPSRACSIAPIAVARCMSTVPTTASVFLNIPVPNTAKSQLESSARHSTVSMKMWYCPLSLKCSKPLPSMRSMTEPSLSEWYRKRSPGKKLFGLFSYSPKLW